MTEPPPLHLASPAMTPPSPQHLAQIASARQQFKLIQRGASTASFSAWTIAIFGALSVITSFKSVVGMGLGIGMCVLSHFEFKGATEMRRLRPEAAWHLARNQLILGVLIVIYSGTTLWTSLKTPPESQKVAGEDAEVVKMLGFSPDDMVRKATIALYSTLIAAGVLGCGGTAMYYARRKRMIELYVQQTPSWIVELQRAGMSV